MLLLKSKPVITVEQIHKEFDDAEDKLIDECTKVLSELKIPTENQLINKAKKLEQLGFVNSETIHKAKDFEKRSKAIEDKIKMSSELANLISELKIEYPTNKFISVEQLNEICNKYNLIYAPVKNYIKDVPEKNLLEIENSKLLKDKYLICEYYLSFTYHGTKRYDFKDINIDKETFYRLYNSTYRTSTLVEIILENKFNLGKTIKDSTIYLGDIKNIDYYSKKLPTLFIAAPKSHFNLKDLTKKGKNGFFSLLKPEIKITEVPKDPVVFQLITNNLCRIITKWGTDDDQSYLDPILQNEPEN